MHIDRIRILIFILCGSADLRSMGGAIVAERLARPASLAAALLLSAFFGFVGWNKAFASIAELARHGAWTVWLPEWLGRLVGWSEMVLALGLLGAVCRRTQKAAYMASIALVANQLVAATVHVAHGESGALPQNAVLVLLMFCVAGSCRHSVMGEAE